MFIPNYQIHNILKGFTRQLKNGNRLPEPGHRLETVANRVAGAIMNRVNRLSAEEARRRIQLTGGPGDRTASPTDKHLPGAFHYQTLGHHHQKIEKQLSVENSKQLIDRFLRMIDPSTTEPADE